VHPLITGVVPLSWIFSLNSMYIFSNSVLREVLSLVIIVVAFPLITAESSALSNPSFVVYTATSILSANPSIIGMTFSSTILLSGISTSRPI
jgi:hypothetical protein